MKVLVYGTGGIGSLTVHALCRAGNETAVAAKGKRREILREKGLQIRTHSGRKRWTDHPEVLDHEDESFFDAVFSIMQNQQQERILETLAGVPARYLVLVGNNLKSGEMEEKLLSLGWSKEQILFGFQESAGARHQDFTEAVTFGTANLILGHRNRALTGKEQAFFRELFAGSCMKLTFLDDMESWYRCHAAFILPAVCLFYGHSCDLHTCSFRDITLWIRAGKDGYDFLSSIGTRIWPVGDEKNLVGIRGGILAIILWLCAKTRIGEPAVTDPVSDFHLLPAAGKDRIPIPLRLLIARACRHPAFPGFFSPPRARSC